MDKKDVKWIVIASMLALVMLWAISAHATQADVDAWGEIAAEAAAQREANELEQRIEDLEQDRDNRALEDTTGVCVTIECIMRRDR